MAVGISELAIVAIIAALGVMFIIAVARADRRREARTEAPGKRALRFARAHRACCHAPKGSGRHDDDEREGAAGYGTGGDRDDDQDERQNEDDRRAAGDLGIPGAPEIAPQGQVAVAGEPAKHRYAGAPRVVVLKVVQPAGLGTWVLVALIAVIVAAAVAGAVAFFALARDSVPPPWDEPSQTTPAMPAPLPPGNWRTPIPDNSAPDSREAWPSRRFPGNPPAPSFPRGDDGSDDER